MSRRLALAVVPMLAAGVAVLVASILEPLNELVWAPLMVPAVLAGTWWGGWPLGSLTLLVGLVGRSAIVDGPIWSPLSWVGPWLAVHGVIIAGVPLASRARAERTEARRIQAEQAERARRVMAARRTAFLAHASRVLASSPDYQSTLSAVANLAVPQIADLCVVDLLQDDGSFAAVAVAHVSPEKVQLVRELRRMYPLDPKATSGPPRVLRTGRSAVYEESAEGSGTAPTLAETRIATALGIKSTMAVPLLVGGRRLGVISFSTTDSARRFVSADLLFAEDLARRAAIAIDAARP